MNNLKDFYFNIQQGYPINLITYLSKFQVNKLRTKEFVDSVVFYSINNSSALKIYPWDNHISWTMENFGPYVIPEKSQKINLNGKNYFIYNKLILENELNIDCKLEENYNQGIKYFNFYEFKKNYYFIIGDNLQKSNDSRFWGPIPEENIIGKAVIILFNYNNGKFCWDRFLKKIE